MAHAVLFEWCANHISCQESQHDYTWYWITTPLLCIPPTHNPASIIWHNKLLWFVFSEYSRIWEWWDFSDSSHSWRTFMGSINKRIFRETKMMDHQEQISIPATVARGPVFVSAAISYFMAYDVIDNDDLVTALSCQIQISITPIGMVWKPSVELIVLAQR